MDRPQGYQKHVPVRTCVVCKTKDAKRLLTRLVRTDAGTMIDLSGKMNGRGTYLCDSRSCWECAVNTNILEKALKSTLTIEDRQRLQRAMPAS